MTWSAIPVPHDIEAPAPLSVRVESLTPRTYFPEHEHQWGQVAYAISGVLSVAIPGRSFIISPRQAAWLPAGVSHRVGSLMGAEFRSLWITTDVTGDLPDESAVFSVAPLLRALIAEAAVLQQGDDDVAYRGRVTDLILDQLRRARPLPAALPWPRSARLTELCEALYADPTDARSAEQWSQQLGISARTLTRRFEADLGMSLRSWRRRMRLFRSIEMLGGDMDITQIALELGYASSSAFAFAFRTTIGVSPTAYLRGDAASP
ncbi:cupin [Phenylobacterium sp. Root77]|uniref:AraC family transcriptional regulator n=1 Tax=unclassified Phenylobacterium TaxID=2640670 RepID=UPI0006F2E112|nr:MULTISPECIES: helix-turn-helix transcriptional regulator [unclassified Phenylobacterium]KQW65503.1 cupin [Phenylobacterium sp. Root1277]KQW94188.1 cupin [Phenylobacterium sp. Root1290]KRC39010.1 cupin [Phenylobacterium sp. Root77]